MCDFSYIAANYSVYILFFGLFRFYQRPVKKGSYPLRPGVEGFFITCDGGREYQASQEAINVIDSVCTYLILAPLLKTKFILKIEPLIWYLLINFLGLSNFELKDLGLFVVLLS